MNKGILAGVAVYITWGVLPLYWKAIQAVPAEETLAHRIFWSLVFAWLLLAVRNRWDWLRQAKENPKILIVFVGTGCLIGANWFIYIWAVNSGHIVDASLGYFINPLLNVFLGVVFLRETLTPWQGVAIALASAGVLYLTVGYGEFPWVALSLALTFGFYGLMRKVARLGSLEGLSIETAVLALPAIVYLLFLQKTGAASFGHSSTATSVLLALSGVVTSLPLLLFAYAARRITLATIGFLQYIAPTLQFLLGILLYREPFSETRLLGFAIIWGAVLVYSLEGFSRQRRRARLKASGHPQPCHIGSEG